MSAAQSEFEQRVEQRAKQTAALEQLGIRASELGTVGAVKLATVVAKLQSDVAALQAERPMSRWQRVKEWAIGRGALA